MKKFLMLCAFFVASFFISVAGASEVAEVFQAPYQQKTQHGLYQLEAEPAFVIGVKPNTATTLHRIQIQPLSIRVESIPVLDFVPETKNSESANLLNSNSDSSENKKPSEVIREQHHLGTVYFPSKRARISETARARLTEI